MSRYFVDKDGNGEWTLWRGTNNPDFPIAVLVKFGNREVWTLALRGAGVEDPS